MSKTLTYIEYIQLDKYHHLDEAIEEVCPELLECPEVRRLKEQLFWARKNLQDKLYSIVEKEGDS
jgi:uncharacterized protein YdcH (DUF465 family)